MEPVLQAVMGYRTSATVQADSRDKTVRMKKVIFYSVFIGFL